MITLVAVAIGDLPAFRLTRVHDLTPIYVYFQNPTWDENLVCRLSPSALNSRIRIHILDRFADPGWEFLGGAAVNVRDMLKRAFIHYKPDGAPPSVDTWFVLTGESAPWCFHSCVFWCRCGSGNMRNMQLHVTYIQAVIDREHATSSSQWVCVNSKSVIHYVYFPALSLFDRRFLFLIAGDLPG
jgi:hypothetical protein